MTVPTTLWIITDGLPGPESCQFIEMEDDNGSSHGKDVGIEWKKYPTPSEELAALGPFFSKKEVIPLIQKAHDKMDQENNKKGISGFRCHHCGYYRERAYDYNDVGGHCPYCGSWLKVDNWIACIWCNRRGYDATGILHTDDCIIVEMRKVLGS